MPRLSLCITTYNRAGPLRECLESILVAGAGRDVELVVSDNASTDSTPHVLEEFARRIPWMRWHRLPTNIGGDRNFYRVTEAATGEYAWVIGDDDRLVPSAVDTVLDGLRGSPTLAVLNFQTWDRDFSAPLSVPRFPADGARHYQSADTLMRAFGLGPSFISAVVFRRDIFLSLPFAEYETLVANGMAFFFAAYRTMWLAPDARYLPEVLVEQRGHNVPALAEMFTWYRYFVQGVGEALDKLAALGYSADARERTRNQVLLELVIPDIWNRVQSGAPVREVYPLLRRYYARSPLFWMLAVPALYAPTWLLRSSRGTFRRVRSALRR